MSRESEVTAVRPPPAERQLPDAGHYVLCVDDDPEFLKSLEFFLPEQVNQEIPPEFQYRFLFLQEPEAVVDAVRDLLSAGESVAMVISDQKMPRMKGTRLLSEVRELTPGTVRVLLTGYAGMDSAIEAINLRLLDKYLIKPIENEHDFTLNIRHLLERHQLALNAGHMERLKTDFLTFISHELRSPLAAMSAIELLDESTLPEEHREAIELIHVGYRRLLAFIQSGLDYFTWLGADRRHVAEATDLVEAVRWAVDEETALRERDAELELQLPASAVPALIEELALVEVIRILLNNAVKHSGDRPRIRVGIDSGGGPPVLTVSDRGKGFEAGWGRELFRPFTVLDSMHHGEGSGLSLARAAAILGAYGGRIWAESPGPDRGATFRVLLRPGAAVPAPAATPV